MEAKNILYIPNPYRYKSKKMLFFFDYWTYIGMEIFKKNVALFWLLDLYRFRLLWVWIRYERFSRQTEKTFFLTQNCKRHKERYYMSFVMKEHLSNPPSIRLDYHLFVFSFPFLLSKLTVCDIEKGNFQICIQSWSARMRVQHLKVT